MMMEKELTFAMPMVFKDQELRTSSNFDERQMWQVWKDELIGKVWYLIGWNDVAYAITDELGSYRFEYISGHPFDLFKPA